MAIQRVLGLMSGTSLDGIDAAIIDTDGEDIVDFGPSLFHRWTAAQRQTLSQAIGMSSPAARARADQEVTAAHIAIIHAIFNTYNISADLIGFHGQTILHAPDQGRTWQIGSAAEIARAIGIDVVGDFRSADVAAGGQGAPLAPLYHRALARKSRAPLPLCIVNIGGVANISFIGAGDELIAFDTGPGNGLMDQWAASHIGIPYDENGALAAQGQPDEAALAGYMGSAFFQKLPPKSLDRHDFTIERIGGLSSEDGAATLLAFTARSIAAAADHLLQQPDVWVLCGGGRHNRVLCAQLDQLLSAKIITAEKMGWDGDMIEAQAFAYLAMRTLRGLPLTLPTTTGVAAPLTGGRLFKSAR